jgi:hypothetical protein
MEQMMRPVAQHQLERVFSRRQFNKRLGLSGAEMKMFLVLWDRRFAGAGSRTQLGR